MQFCLETGDLINLPLRIFWLLVLQKDVIEGGLFSPQCEASLLVVYVYFTKIVLLI